MEENNDLKQNSEREDLLAEESYINDHYEYATQGQRFLNWLIDNLLMRYGLAYLTGMGVGLIIGIVAPDFFENVAYSGGMTGTLFFLGILIAYLNYIIYYTLCKNYSGVIHWGNSLPGQEQFARMVENSLLGMHC